MTTLTPVYAVSELPTLTWIEDDRLEFHWLADDNRSFVIRMPRKTAYDLRKAIAATLKTRTT